MSVPILNKVLSHEDAVFSNSNVWHFPFMPLLLRLNFTNTDDEEKMASAVTHQL